MIVYKATNLINNKCYVGYTTKTLNQRIKVHLYKTKSKNDKHYFYIFPSAIRKYGIENFKWEILYETDDLKDVQEKEIYFIKHLNTIAPNGYNLTEGGNGGIQSEETRKKMSISQLKRYEENPGSSYLERTTTEQRKENAKKAWETKRENGFEYPTGFLRSNVSKLKQKETLNNLGKLKWYNIYSKETIELSCTKMAEYTGLSIGIFSHLKHGRQEKTKCGWTYLKY